MEFKVRFVACSSPAFVYGTPESTVGLKDIEALRQHYRIPLDIHKVRDLIGHRQKDSYVLKLSEAQAKQTGLFEDQSEQDVKVPSFGLNAYRVKEYGYEAATTCYTVDWTIDAERLWHDWQQAGYPLTWKTCASPTPWWKRLFFWKKEGL